MPALLLRVAWRSRREGAHARHWAERLGVYRRSPPAARPVWVHAVSVGESMAAVPLIRALRERPDPPDILVTTTTLTGAQAVQRTLGDSVFQVFFPYDLPPVIARFLDRFNPSLLVVLETELWPNTLEACRRRGIPVILANARLSQRSLRGYARLAPLTRDVMRAITWVAAQSEADAERFRRLGADPAGVCVTGSLKFDLELPASLLERAEALRRVLGVNRPILMLGSTREGEEAILFDACRRLAREFENLLVVLAPRHPERFASVGEAARAAGFRVVTHSGGKPCGADDELFLLDVMGDLPRFYAAADVAFVGGSLLPYGGHNVLEPAALGRPVVSGPHTENFAEVCRLLEQGGALVVARDAEAIAAAVAHWLRDSNERDRVGRAGREVVRRHRGATRRTVELVDRCLDGRPAEPR